jgi:archaellum component FlaF (FlaF/FlaG flagellin family)
MTKKKTENGKTFSDFTNKSWFMDGNNVKVGDSFQKIMSGESTTIEVKEILYGDQFQTWRIVIDKTDKTYLLKTSRELK